GDGVLDLIRVQARLRRPDGCPWDREQTHQTLARHLLEETHELLEAIDREDDDAIRDELGDLLLQVTFHAQIAADEGRWDVDDVAEGLVRKLIHRHPHVFADVEVADAGEVLVNWEQLKADEAAWRGGPPRRCRRSRVPRRCSGARPAGGSDGGPASGSSTRSERSSTRSRRRSTIPIEPRKRSAICC